MERLIIEFGIDGEIDRDRLNRVNIEGSLDRDRQ